MTLKNISSTIVFFLELWMLYAFALFGYNNGSTTISKYVWAILLPATVIAIWAVFAAPKSKNRLKSPYQQLLRIVLFLAAAWFLYTIHQPVSAIILAALAVVTQIISYYYKE